MKRYEVVPHITVDKNLRYAVSNALEFCLNDLEIKNRPKIQWISEIRNGARRYSGEVLDQTGPIFGCVRYMNNTIYLNTDQSIRDLKNTVAHECRHIYQREKLVNQKVAIPIGYDREVDARAYAEDSGQALCYWPGTPMLARQCTAKAFYIQQEAPKPQVSAYQASSYSMYEGSSGNGNCQIGGCGKKVVNRFSRAPISRHFCDVHAKEELWRLENEGLKFR